LENEKTETFLTGLYLYSSWIKNYQPTKEKTSME